MLEIKHLTKIYNEGKKNSFTALKDINFSVERNSVTVIKGVSGSGKSTLLSLIAGFAKPTQGEVLIGSTSISKLPEAHMARFRREHIGFVFQSFALIEDLSVCDNILAALVPVVHVVSEQKRIETALQKAHIAHKQGELVKNLSGGEKQRCAIARALVNSPSTIIADEPTANLDKQSSLKFIAMLEELKTQGKTIIIATHDTLFENCAFIDKTVAMQEGTLLL